MIRVSAFKWVPPFAQGLVRDLRVRWALEEAGWPYEERLIGLDDRDSPDYRALHLYGQVPAYEEDDLVLFESGAIVLHIAERSDALMPADEDDRARVRAWMFCALDSVETPIKTLNLIDIWGYAEKVGDFREKVEGYVDIRLAPLEARLGERDYLEAGRFTAADVLMVSVLRILRGTGVMDRYPVLSAYQARCESRPAFQKALAAQMAPFEANAPA